MRIKKIAIEGEEYIIGALTLKQVEEYITPLENMLDENKSAKIRAYDLICFGLNNGSKSSGNGAAPWTPDRVREEMDLVVFTKLQSEILDFSGLRITQPGETPAVTT